jgi:hypothetical protein
MASEQPVQIWKTGYFIAYGVILAFSTWHWFFGQFFARIEKGVSLSKPR